MKFSNQNKNKIKSIEQTKERIEQTQKALREALDINDEVNLLFLFFIIQLRNKIKKINEIKEQLKLKIKEKDESIYELSLFYEVSYSFFILNNCRKLCKKKIKRKINLKLTKIYII